MIDCIQEAIEKIYPNRELVDAESMQSKNEFIQLYQSDATWFDGRSTHNKTKSDK